MLYVIAAIAATASIQRFWFIEATPFSELTTAEAVSFATYYGDIITPIAAFLSLAAFLRTLKQQQAQIEARKL
ncbi:hypothetical protein LCGC14_0155440 [marine sediment metagenome]|uniref:Uncharacterized protein n=1 Tax=marine sediment metagenome TaxID=412755 RepID=A0A0F9UXG4_9ZZZZ|nr:hypothetical protein [Halomonas sp.]HDZ46967.1 hypothetical protein [Halomonas sp.]HEB06785.1 hypothetical protein [Halomonas sp.]